jgi:hypothetical protein
VTPRRDFARLGASAALGDARRLIPLERRNLPDMRDILRILSLGIETLNKRT